LIINWLLLLRWCDLRNDFIYVFFQFLFDIRRKWKLSIFYYKLSSWNRPISPKLLISVIMASISYFWRWYILKLFEKIKETENTSKIRSSKSKWVVPLILSMNLWLNSKLFFNIIIEKNFSFYTPKRCKKFSIIANLLLNSSPWKENKNFVE